MKVKVTPEEIDKHCVILHPHLRCLFPGEIILEATPLKEEICIRGTINCGTLHSLSESLTTNPPGCSPKEKEECCGHCVPESPKKYGDEVCLTCPVHGFKKQEIELPEDINMKEVGEYAAKTDCGITEALTYILWIRYNKLLKYLKQ